MAKAQIEKTLTNAAGETMTIGLVKFKHSEFASEETHCYTAEVLVDGKLAFRARNQGFGGPDFYEAFGDKHDKALLEKAEKFCKALPKYKSEFSGEYYDMDLEIVMGDLVEDLLVLKDKEKSRKKMVKEATTKAAFRTPDMKAGVYGTWKSPFSASLKAQALQKYPNADFLADRLAENPDIDVDKWLGL